MSARTWRWFGPELGRLVLATLLATALAACPINTSNPVVAPADVGVELPADAVADAPPDVAPDAVPDTVPDTPPDAVPDAVPTPDADVAEATPDADVGPSGPSFTVATWNLLNFSEYGTNEWRLDAVAEKIDELAPELIGLEELKLTGDGDTSQPQAFDGLLERLPAYQGVHIPWNPKDTVVGLLYRPAVVTLVAWRALYVDDWYAFPRDPLEAEVVVHHDDGTETHFFLVVIHLKAFQEEVDRRRAGCERLVTHVAAQPDRRYLIVGDFNDDPYDAAADNAFTGTFLGTEPTWHFLTHVLPPESVTSTGWHHYVDGRYYKGEFIDHAVMTGELIGDFAALKPVIHAVGPNDFEDWRDTYSDHFPVLLELTLP